MLSKKFSRVSLFVVSLYSIIALLFMLLSGSISAQGNQIDQGIQLSPVVIDLNAKRSQQYNLKITITNVTPETQTYKMTTNDFRSKDETGNPEIIFDDSSENDDYSAAGWITTLPNFTLLSKQSTVLTVPVYIPSNAEAGGHYAVVRFSSTGTGTDGNLALTGSAGVLTLIRVEGKINEKLSIKSLFASSEANGSAKTVFESSPKFISLRLENIGNVHVKPAGTATVKNIFGSTVDTINVNDPPRNVLPSSVRRFDQSFAKKLLPGRYTIEADLAYGVGAQTVSARSTFWVIPYKILALVAVLIVGGIVLGKRLLKHYHKHVIRKYRSRR